MVATLLIFKLSSITEFFFEDTILSKSIAFLTTLDDYTVDFLQELSTDLAIYSKDFLGLVEPYKNLGSKVDENDPSEKVKDTAKAAGNLLVLIKKNLGCQLDEKQVEEANSLSKSFREAMSELVRIAEERNLTVTKLSLCNLVQMVEAKLFNNKPSVRIFRVSLEEWQEVKQEITRCLSVAYKVFLTNSKEDFVKRSTESNRRERRLTLMYNNAVETISEQQENNSSKSPPFVSPNQDKESSYEKSPTKNESQTGNDQKNCPYKSLPLPPVDLAPPPPKEEVEEAKLRRKVGLDQPQVFGH